MHNMEKEIRLGNKIEVKYIPTPKDMIQVMVNGRDMYFTETEFVSSFRELGKLWSRLNDEHTSKK